MKLLTIAIPCFNSQEYMRYCIESLLPGGDNVEILIVNDGSTDQTPLIADEYQARYPDIVKVIHQENGGHGAAVNSGMFHASGQYFKVVDSDDWVDIRAYLKILKILKNLAADNKAVDMVVSNFVYEKEGARYKKVMKYENVLPEGEIFTWENIGQFRRGQYILMHSVIYRTQLLRECELELPKHTFYVDNLFVFVPLKHVERIIYVNVDFYRYYIGRQDQSVNETVMIKRVDQQIKVNKLMIDQANLDSVSNTRLHEYMLSYLEIVTVVSLILLIRSGTEENLKKKKGLLRYIKDKDTQLYSNLRYGLLGQMVTLPGKMGRYISISAYKLSQKIVGFN